MPEIKKGPSCPKCSRILEPNPLKYTTEQIADGKRIKYFCTYCDHITYYEIEEDKSES